MQQDDRDMRAEYGLGPPIDETQKRLDVLIALQRAQVAFLRAQASANAEPAPAPDDGHPQTIELREPTTTPAPTARTKPAPTKKRAS